MRRFSAMLLLGLVFIGTCSGLAISWAAVPPTPELPRPTLQELAARHDIQVGNYADLRLLHEPAFAAILTSEFAFAMIDGDLNWAFNSGTLRPTADTFDFSKPDVVLQFTAQHGMPVQAHHYVWGEEKWLPQWLKDGNYNREQLHDLIKNHIMTVGQHYRGKIREWSVVNEAFSRQQGVNGLYDWWHRHVGDNSYIDAAFHWARLADPDAKLLYNDFGNETPNAVSDATYDYMVGAVARGVPIDGIGFQMHIDGNKPPAKQAMIANMKRFGDLGLEVYVTELDVMLTNTQGSKQQRYETQKAVYRDVAEACLESGVCHSFAVLGVTDKKSWWTELGLRNADPLPFDYRYQPKPAYFGLREAFD